MTTAAPVTAFINNDKGLLKPLRKIDEVKIGLRFIQSSPYEEKSHWLDLHTLDYEYQILALALQVFSSRKENYAIDSYEESFNIPEVVGLAYELAKQFGKPLKEFEVYVIAFRSRLKPEIQQSSEKRQFLGEVDCASHREANVSGGLLKYWYGVPNEEAFNLATCWWRNRQDARFGGTGSSHREGVNRVRNWYAHWAVEEYKVTLKNGGYSFDQIN